MISSLAQFFVLLFYEGGFGTRVSWILLMFTMGSVALARLSIEQSREYSIGYAIALGIAAFIVMTRFVSNPVANLVILGLIGYLSDIIVHDCTLIDEEEDSSGQGLIDAGRVLVREKKERYEKSKATSSESSSPTMVQSEPHRGRAKHQPGRTVFYLALAALPLFGFGQFFLDDDRAWASSLVYLAFYLFSSLSLLVTTSFLGLRRYLRQRNADMPPNVSVAWLAGGVGLIALVLMVAYLAPLPGSALASFQAPKWLTSPDQQASSMGWGGEGADESDSDSAQTPDDPKPQGKQTQGKKDQKMSPDEKTVGDKNAANKDSRSAPPSEEKSKQGKQGKSDESSSQSKSGEKPSDKSPSQKSQQKGSKDSKQQSSSEQKQGESKSKDSKSQTSESQSKARGKKQSESQSKDQQDAESKKRSDPSKPKDSRDPDSKPNKESQQTKDGEQSDKDQADSESSDSASEKARKQREEQQRQQQEQRQKQESRQSDSASSSPPKQSPPSSLPSIGSLFSGLIGLLKFVLFVVLLVIVAMFLWKNWAVIAAWWANLFGNASQTHETPKPQLDAIDPGLPPRPFSSFRNPLGIESDPRQIVVITFQAFEAWMRERGSTRGKDETPDEFVRRIHLQQPGLSDPIRRLAGAYNRVVYGRGNAGPQDLDAAKRIWQSMTA